MREAIKVCPHKWCCADASSCDQALRNRIAELEASAKLVDEHVVTLHEQNAMQHRVILAAATGNTHPAVYYVKLEAALAAEQRPYPCDDCDVPCTAEEGGTLVRGG